MTDIPKRDLETNKEHFKLFQIDANKLPPYLGPQDFTSKIKICSVLEDDFVTSSGTLNSKVLH